jgi:hypothetical protein
VRVSAAGHQRDGRKLDLSSALLRLHDDSMDVSFDMIHCDQRSIGGEAQRLRIGDADEKRSYKPGTLCHSDRVERRKRYAGLADCAADHGNDRPQMLAGRQLRYHSAILAMGVEL